MAVEILKRAKGDSGEIVAFNESESSVREEVLKRASKAGYCTRNGEPDGTFNIRSRAFTEQGRKNYERIFGHN